MYVPSRKRLELRSLKCRTVYYAATVVTIAGHALVLAVTWRRTYGIRKLVNASSMGTSLSSLILRDGSVYFGLIMLLDVAGLISYMEYSAVTSCFVTAIQPIVLARFFLNLREAALAPDLPTHASRLSFMNSHHALASIAGSIVFNAERETAGGDCVYEEQREEDGHVLTQLSAGV
ncbi:hypothetical protein C8Q72DRAFT_657194 [Fomitopsis betulina]|nr:hypothetical protein C8Q72DRAFT_657194 [Fomitopsis betulina]